MSVLHGLNMFVSQCPTGAHSQLNLRAVVAATCTLRIQCIAAVPVDLAVHFHLLL